MKKNLMLSFILSMISMNALSNNLNMTIDKPIYVSEIESFSHKGILNNKKENKDSKVFFKTKVSIQDKEYNISYGFIGIENTIINVRDISGSEELLKSNLKKDNINYEDFVNELDKKVKELKVNFIPGRQIGFVDGWDEKNPKQIIGQKVYNGKLMFGNIMNQFEVNVAYIISDKKEFKLAWIGSASTGQKDEVMISRLRKEGYTEEMFKNEVIKVLKEQKQII